MITADTVLFETRYYRLFFVFVTLGFLTNCSMYSQQAKTVRDALLVDQIDVAYAIVENRSNRSDAVLNLMNKGMLKRMKGDFYGSNQHLEKAKRKIKKLYGVSVTEQLGSITINDTLIKFKGARFEQLLIHAYMAMNYIDSGDLDAARVEMLQADVKIQEWDSPTDIDPFTTYLAGMVFEALGEFDQAIIAYRHAYTAYENNRDKQNLDAPLSLISSLMRLLKKEGLTEELSQLETQFAHVVKHLLPQEPSSGELIVVLSNGLAPIKSQYTIHQYAEEIENDVLIALPFYKQEINAINLAKVVIDEVSLKLEVVENIDGLARYALEDEMPLILTRAIARAIVKHKTQHKSNEDNSPSRFLFTIFNLATERADTRSWSTLPQEIQMTRQTLKAGKHTIEIELINQAGYVVDRITDNIMIEPGEITFLFKHWVSPKIKPIIQPQESTHEGVSHV